MNQGKYDAAIQAYNKAIEIGRGIGYLNVVTEGRGGGNWYGLCCGFPRPNIDIDGYEGCSESWPGETRIKEIFDGS